MKSGTSFFNRTVFRKDITRFSPVWGLYSVVLLLSFLFASADYGILFALDSGFMGMSSMPFINFVYALICAVLLFGDLFDSRLCNALHAMPIRREGWFVTHLLSGISFSLIPNLAAAAILSLRLTALRFIPWLWLAAMTMEFLIFFALAVFCVQLTGKKFAAVAVYGLVNFLSALIYWIVNTIYIPLLPGVVLGSIVFTVILSPMGLMSSVEYLNFTGLSEERIVYEGIIKEGWGMLLVLTALAAVLLVVTVLLYRRRKLERAGDFVAVRPLAPVFLVLYTLLVGVFFEAFGVLIVGIAVGFFTGLMLLNRTVRVFTKKAFAGFALSVLALAVSMLVTWLDPAGLVEWLPEVSEVKSVKVSVTGFYSGAPVSDADYIEAVKEFHKSAMEDRESGGQIQASLTYEMEDGSTVQRQYIINADQPDGQRFEALLSDPRYVLAYEDWEKFKASVLLAQYYKDGYHGIGSNGIDALLEAIRADCEAGNMAQCWSYHADEESVRILLTISDGSTDAETLYLSVYECCENAWAWLDARGYTP